VIFPTCSSNISEGLNLAHNAAWRALDFNTELEVVVPLPFGSASTTLPSLFTLIVTTTVPSSLLSFTGQGFVTILRPVKLIPPVPVLEPI
jgi:hypothetical protein